MQQLVHIQHGADDNHSHAADGLDGRSDGVVHLVSRTVLAIRARAGWKWVSCNCSLTLLYSQLSLS